jgi:hypothetical protein
LADLILDGALEANLRNWRQSGMSRDDVAKHLWLETDQQVSITGVGVQRWARELGIEDSQPENAA